MFDILFGWRKASKCKQLIKVVQCRLKLLKNKRATIVRQLREDAAELIKKGYEDKVFNRVEHIIRDENTVALYELLENFCEFILLHLSYIRRRKDCPNDINEAVSSLIYASARCGDLPELRKIRKLFAERYGHKFATTALELFPGNLVNFQVIEKLTPKPVSDDMKQRLVNDIARNYCIKPEVLAIEYYSDWQQKVKEASGYLAMDSNDQTCRQRSDIQFHNAEKLHSEDVNDAGVVCTTLVPMLAPTISDSPFHDETLEVETSRVREIVVCNDDIEEFQSCTTRNGDEFQDKRAFKFKTCVPKRENLENSYVTTWSVNSGSDVAGRSLKVNERRPRKRSVSKENQFSKDHDFSRYYARKHQKKMGSDLLSCKCSLVNPCYVCNGKQNAEFEAPTIKTSRAISTRVGFGIPSHDRKNLVYNVVTNTDHNNPQCKLPSHASSSSSPTVPTSWMRREMVPPYLRNATMPPERAKDKRKEEFRRSVSDSVKYPNHVHPNLPDYDDIAATFQALKKERLQTKL